ncbi:MAG: sugar transferase [Pseudomonadota bacterium]
MKNGTNAATIEAHDELLDPMAFAMKHSSGRRRNRFTRKVFLAFWWLNIRVQRALKRCIDFLGAAVGLLLLSPLLIIVAICIKLDSRGPVFYSQIRVGERGKTFRMYKFRSMRTDADEVRAELEAANESADGVIFKMKEDPRVTRLGRFIRRFSIDELPQLYNILRGDMAIVGPRPALPSEVAQYDIQARKRLQTKPGLTCIWQVSGRSNLSFSQQIDLDIEYLSSKSTKKDIELIAKTIPAVIDSDGAY